mgnify:CR=1 FL=1
MERIGEEISQYGILAESVETGDSELPAFCTDAAAALWIRGKVGQYADHVTVKKADVYGENGEIEFAAEYQEEIPFFETGSGETDGDCGCETEVLDRNSREIKGRRDFSRW